MKKINKKYLIYWVNIILLMLNTGSSRILLFSHPKKQSTRVKTPPYQ